MRVMVSIVIVFIVAIGLFFWRQIDHRSDQVEMERLIALQPISPLQFSKSMVADLPSSARRFFDFVIAEGTPLFTVAEIEMNGQFSLGSKESPNYLDMKAVQILAPPHGFVWKMSGGSGLMHLSGSDAGAWTRFWIAGILPVARLGGDVDHARSAFGRYAAESAFWAPASLLPQFGVAWTMVDDDTARFTMERDGIVQDVEITLDEQGLPVRVEFERWSNANADGVHRLQPFGGFLSEFREFQGFHLPTNIEAGNFFGTDDYFPFFIVDVTDVRFPQPEK